MKAMDAYIIITMVQIMRGYSADAAPHSGPNFFFGGLLVIVPAISTAPLRSPEPPLETRFLYRHLDRKIQIFILHSDNEPPSQVHPRDGGRLHLQWQIPKIIVKHPLLYHRPLLEFRAFVVFCAVSVCDVGVCHCG